MHSSSTRKLYWRILARLKIRILINFLASVRREGKKGERGSRALYDCARQSKSTVLSWLHSVPAKTHFKEERARLSSRDRSRAFLRPRCTALARLESRPLCAGGVTKFQNDMGGSDWETRINVRWWNSPKRTLHNAWNEIWKITRLQLLEKEKMLPLY